MVGFPFLYFGVCYGMEFKQECFESRAKCKVVPYKKKVILEHSFRIFVEDNGEGKDG